MTVVIAVGLNTLAKGVRTGVASKSRILYINGLQEVTTHCDVELGRDYAMEQRDLFLRRSV